MNYFFSIFLRDLNREKFYEIIETLEQFSGSIVEVEKSLILGQSDTVEIVASLLKMREFYPEMRFGFSQYPGLAKGLSRIAKFGEVLISEEVEQKLLDDFEITSLGMLTIEGMSSQILVCRIDQPRGDLKFPKQIRKENRISRAGQIDAMENLLSVSNAVLIVGPTGIGKTVFIDQLVERWQEQKEVLRTVCPPIIRRLSLEPIMELVEQLLEIEDVESIGEKQQAIERRLKELGIADIGTTYLAVLDFLGLSEEETILEKMDLKVRVDLVTTNIAEIIKRMSWNRPLVIIVEDVENMDPSSVNFMQNLILKLADENVYFIFSSALSQVNISGIKEFELREIEREDLINLVKNEINEEIKFAAATPLHIAQFLRLYREERLDYFYKQYQGEAAIGGFNLPFHDFKTVVKRRVELLEEKKDFIYNLAIAGIKIIPDEFPVDKDNLGLFEYFVKRGFLRRFLNYYIFINPLLHNEIYDLIPDKKRRHQHLADYYSRLEGYEELAAYHLQQAESYNKAIEYLIKSAQLVVGKGAYDSGINYYKKALELCQQHRELANLEILVAINEGLADIYRALDDEETALKYYKVVLDSYKEILKE
ncbi:hypothetical protein BXT86_00615 [candidate division WOR-3 bacterium 4484_100]|uniref:Orc1-like AAA ATPase domain-containing protein n=1 Tax=candidate division WOR-3 bacterium 4484_100 TaxID=1936077 RepID=A0A1V4QGS4_UNCW3|nr:MAG: hypothetical protein BXT86_00615 [candidate division WOR-3 bacterium 4484_100]